MDVEGRVWELISDTIIEIACWDWGKFRIVRIGGLKVEIQFWHSLGTSWKLYRLSLLIQCVITLTVHEMVYQILCRGHYFLSIIHFESVCMYVFVRILPLKTRRIYLYATDNMNQSFCESLCSEHSLLLSACKVTLPEYCMTVRGTR